MAREVELERLIVRLLGDGTSYQKMMATGGKATKTITTKMQSALIKTEQVAKRTGKVLTAAITLPLVGIGIAATKMAVDLNASMANVATLGLAPERVLELKKNVQDLAVTVGKSTADISGGLFQVVSAFGDSAESAKLLEINAKAAAAGLATTTDAINLTSAVTKGYGDTSAEAVQKASDLAFVTNKLGQTTFPELAASIGAVIPLAAEMQISQEELFAVMATGTGVTGNAAAVTTQLRGVIQGLMAPSKGMAKLLKDLGFESGKAMIAQQGLIGAIDTIVRVAKESGTPLQEYLGSIEGQTIALALAGSQSDVYRVKLAAMRNATGATEEAFKAQTQGINASGFALKQLKAQVSVMAQDFGDALIPALSETLKRLEPFISKVGAIASAFKDSTKETKDLVLVLAAGAIFAGPVLIAIATFSTAIRGISSAFLLVRSSALASKTAIGGVIALGAVAFFGAVTAQLVLMNEELRKAVEKVSGMVGKRLEKIAEIKDPVERRKAIEEETRLKLANLKQARSSLAAKEREELTFGEAFKIGTPLDIVQGAAKSLGLREKVLTPLKEAITTAENELKAVQSLRDRFSGQGFLAPGVIAVPPRRAAKNVPELPRDFIENLPSLQILPPGLKDLPQGLGAVIANANEPLVVTVPKLPEVLRKLEKGLAPITHALVVPGLGIQEPLAFTPRDTSAGLTRGGLLTKEGKFFLDTLIDETKETNTILRGIAGEDILQPANLHK